jgi:hypothetical protein
MNDRSFGDPLSVATILSHIDSLDYPMAKRHDIVRRGAPIEMFGHNFHDGIDL